MPENPDQPPKEDSPQIASEKDRQAGVVRKLFTAYVSVAVFVAVAMIAAYFYAWWHDPWMTPRFSPSMTVWWNVRTKLEGLLFLLLIAGMVLLVATAIRQAWQRFFLLLAAVALLAIAQWLCWQP